MPAFIVSCDLIFRKTFSMVQSRKIRFLAGKDVEHGRNE
jgi:hypothetical protein